MSSCENTFYRGEDIEFAIDLQDLLFSELGDLIVGVRIDDAIQKTLKKSVPTEVVADPGNLYGCLARVFRVDTVAYPLGNLMLEVTPVLVDAGFAEGKHETYIIAVGEMADALTKGA